MGSAARKRDEHLQIDLLPGMREVFDEIEQFLGASGRRRFRDELSHAFFEAMRTGSDRPLNETVQAWYRTLLFKRSGVDKRIADLPEFNEDDTFSAAEAREYLGL